jgi:predicted nucleic acid-binding protein
VSTFVDTSALLALLDEDEQNHAAAAAWMRGAGAAPDETLMTHNYIVVEAAALVHRRLGPRAIRVLLDAWIPAMTVQFVDEQLHRSGTSAFLAAASRRVSLVDCVSFELMRGHGIRRAFAFDRTFASQGFKVVP